MSEKEDIIWLKCPDCGSSLGIMMSVGKGEKVSIKTREEWPPKTIEAKLGNAGVDLELVEVEIGEDIITISPKDFLGDQWTPINDSVRSLGGEWVREGRESHWELKASTFE